MSANGERARLPLLSAENTQVIWWVCCSVLQCVAVCCSVVQCVAVFCIVLQCSAVCCSVLECVAVLCSVLQCRKHTSDEMSASIAHTFVFGNCNTDFSFENCICQSYTYAPTTLCPYIASTFTRGRPDVQGTLGPMRIISKVCCRCETYYTVDMKSVHIGALVRVKIRVYQRSVALPFTPRICK